MAKGIYLACPLVNWNFHEGGVGKDSSDQHFAVCSGAITRFFTTEEDIQNPSMVANILESLPNTTVKACTVNRTGEPEEYVRFAEINSFKQFLLDDSLPPGIHVRELTGTCYEP